MICHRCGWMPDAGDRFCARCGLARTPASDRDGERPSPGNAVSEVRYAGFWLRAVAFLIDRILLGFMTLTLLFLFLPLAGWNRNEDELSVLFLTGALFGFFLRWIYCTLMESSSLRGTLGKAATGLAVTDGEGRRITFLRANGRYWAKILSSLFLGIGYLMAGWTSRKQALHDLIAETLVVRKQAGRKT